MMSPIQKHGEQHRDEGQLEEIKEEEEEESALPHSFSPATAGNTLKRSEDTPATHRLSIVRSDNQYGLSTRHIDFHVPLNHHAIEHVNEREHNENSLDARVLRFLGSERVELFLMGLLVLDVLLLFIEIFLQASFPACSVVEKTCIACCPYSSSGDLSDEEHYLRLLSGGSGDVCEATYGSNYETTSTQACDDHQYAAVHTIEQVLFWLTVCILSTFFIELNIEMIAIRPHVYFLQFFYCLDYFIITISLVGELAVGFAGDDFAPMVGLLVFIRIWRFIRIGHGIMEISAEYGHNASGEHTKKGEGEGERDYNEYIQELEEIIKKNNLTLPTDKSV